MKGRQARGWGISDHEMTNTTRKKAANSIVGKLTAGILAVAAAALCPAGAVAQSGDAVLVIGDSLEVGSAPYLRQALGGVPVTVDARIGRPSPEGVQVLQAKLQPEHGTVVFDLGTNDSPASPGTLAASLAAVRELAGDRCIVVATITRPPVNGVPVDGLNNAIRSFAGQVVAVQVVNWHGVTESVPGLLSRDGVHPNIQGYALRGALMAEGVQACLLGGGAGAGGAGGIPAPRNPDARPPEPPPARRSEPRRPPRRPARVRLGPVGGLARMVGRVATLVGEAGRGARIGVAGAEPEPVLGAPE